MLQTFWNSQKKETKCRLLFTCAGKVASGRDFKSWTETEKPAMSIANWRIRRKFNWVVKNHDKKQTNCKRNLIWQIKLWISILIYEKKKIHCSCMSSFDQRSQYLKWDSAKRIFHTSKLWSATLFYIFKRCNKMSIVCVTWEYKIFYIYVLILAIHLHKKTRQWLKK